MEFLKNPLISPALASDQILKHFPPTTFLIAGTDTFRDENLKFALKLM
jgi:acetyl esterase/lipase